MKRQPRSFGVSLFACGRLHAEQKANDVPPRCSSRHCIPHRDARASIAFFIGPVEQTEPRETQGGHRGNPPTFWTTHGGFLGASMKRQPRSFGVSLFACGSLHAE